MNDLWKQYEADFNAMSDEEIERERNASQSRVDEEQDWLAAVASWEAAGKPRAASGMQLRENSRSEVEAEGLQPGPKGTLND